MNIPTRTILSAICLAGLLFSAVADARPRSSCSTSGFCTATITRVNVNRGDIHFLLDLPASEFNKLACAAGSTVAGMRLPPIDEGNERYQQMFEMVTLAATERIPVEVLVGGSAFDCQALAIALRFQRGH